VQINGSLPMQVLVSASGITLMSLLAYILAWYKAKEAARATSATPSTPTDTTRSRMGVAE